MEPIDPQFSSESDEGTDSTAFSAVALVGFLMSLVGIFSLGYVQTLPVAILGSLFGIYALLFSERFHLSFLSRVLGVLAVIVGVTILSWGLFLRYFHTDYELAQARTVAEKYLDSLRAKISMRSSTSSGSNSMEINHHPSCSQKQNFNEQRSDFEKIQPT